MTTSDVPVHVPDEHKGAFVIERDGKRLATLTYSAAAGDDKIVINHTEVDPALRGTGAGGKLIEAAVTWARAEHRKIIPLCPYVKSVFDKTPDAYADVRA